MAKGNSGDHKTPRRPIQFPSDWYLVAQKIASERPTPTLWYLIELVKKDAEERKLKNLPKTPWDRESAE